MKTNTTLKIVAMLCVICAATLLSGCLTSDESTNNESSVISNVFDNVIDNEPDLPIMLFMDLSDLHGLNDEDIIRFTLFPDGIVESCGVDGYYVGDVPARNCEPGTWTPHGSSGKEFDIELDVFADIHMTILDDGVAEFRFEGILLEGIWKTGGNRIGLERPTPPPTPAPKHTIRSDRMDAIPITVMIETSMTHTSDLRRVLIMEDGVMEICGYPECFDGTWTLHSKTKTSRTYRTSSIDRWTDEVHRTDVTIYNDGTAKYQYVGGDRIYYGTWAPGIDRTQGSGALLVDDNVPFTATIAGALPTDIIQYSLSSDGTVEQCARGECIYGTWKRIGKTITSQTYKLDLEKECTLMTKDDNVATLTVYGSAHTFKGTWR